MKFTKIISIYRVNDDNTVTIKYQEGENEPIYFRCTARLNILVELCKLPQNTNLEALLGLAYVKGKGLSLQIVSYKEV